MTVASASLTGCGFGIAAEPEAVVVSANIEGIVHGGQFPIGAAHIALYLTSSSGYGSTATSVGQATTSTDGNGTFSISVSGITCPANSYAYIVSGGGDPLTPYSNTIDNSAIYLVDALGPCSGLTSIRKVTINELTTIAAAYGIGGFGPSGGAGMTEANTTVTTAVPVLSTSSTNVQGLTDAFTNAQSIVSSTYGQIYTTTPNGAGTVPVSVINELGNILSGCVNQMSASNSGCTNLFTYSTPPSGTGITAPVNTWQAILDIAQYPDTANVTSLHNISGVQVAFGTNMTSAPNDWSIGITYSDPNISSALGMTIDDSDNVWVLGSNPTTLPAGCTTTCGNGYDVLEYTPQGGFVGVEGGSLNAAVDNFRYGAFDKLGNLWLADGNSSATGAGVYELASGATSPTLHSYLSVDGDANNYSVAVDQDNDVWTAAYKKSTCNTGSVTGGNSCALVEYAAGTSPTYTPYVKFTTSSKEDISTAGGARDVVFDVKTGNVWLTDITANDVYFFPVTPSTTAVATASAAETTSPTLGSVAGSPLTNNYGTVGTAVDAASNAWVVVTGGPGSVASGTTSAAIPAGLYELTKTDTKPSTQPASNVNLVTPAYDIMDGNGNLFIANLAAGSDVSSVVEYSTTITTPGWVTTTSNAGISPGASYTASSTPTMVPGTLTGGNLYGVANVSIDRSGALWVLSTGTGTSPSLANLVQILGVAAPTRAVLAYGNYGVKP